MSPPFGFGFGVGFVGAGELVGGKVSLAAIETNEEEEDEQKTLCQKNDNKAMSSPSYDNSVRLKTVLDTRDSQHHPRDSFRR